MSFLPGRLAAAEGAYFLQESKHAAARLADSLPPSSSSPSPSVPPPPSPPPSPADVLPEILRHSLPIKRGAANPSQSLSTASKWVLQTQNADAAEAEAEMPRINANAMNPLRAYVSLPQATFGPKRWQVPGEQPSFSPSTANDLRRRDRSPYPASPPPDKIQALMRGYSQIGKAFAAATFLVFGGVTALSLYTAHRLQLRTTDDIRTKGRDAIQPRVHKLKERITPIRSWVENMSRRWHIQGHTEAKENPIIKEFSKTIGVKTSN